MMRSGSSRTSGSSTSACRARMATNWPRGCVRTRSCLNCIWWPSRVGGGRRTAARWLPVSTTISPSPHSGGDCRALRQAVSCVLAHRHPRGNLRLPSTKKRKDCSRPLSHAVALSDLRGAGSDESGSRRADSGGGARVVSLNHDPDGIESRRRRRRRTHRRHPSLRAILV